MKRRQDNTNFTDLEHIKKKNRHIKKTRQEPRNQGDNDK